MHLSLGCPEERAWDLVAVVEASVAVEGIVDGAVGVPSQMVGDRIRNQEDDA